MDYFEFDESWVLNLLSAMLLIEYDLTETMRMKPKHFLRSPQMSQQLLDASSFHVQLIEALTGNLF